MDALLSRATLIGSAYASSPDDNIIINGGMDIWQMGTTASYAVGTNGKLADRWHVYNNTTGGAITVNQVTTNLPPVTPFCPLLNYALEIDITTADSGADAGDLAIIRYNIEGYDFLKLAQQPMVLSFWVKATVTGTHYVALFNGAADRYCMMPYTVIASDTWEYKTIIFPASPTAGTWNYTNSIGMMINFSLCIGSTYTAGAVVGSWQTGGVYAASGVANNFSSTSNFFRLTGVSLRSGIEPKPFVKRHIAEELVLCMRYFQSFGGTTASEAICTGSSTGSTTSYVLLILRTRMRATPTLTTSADSHFNILSGNSSPYAVSVLTLSAGASGPDSAYIASTHATISGALNDAVSLHANTTSARLRLTAEL